MIIADRACLKTSRHTSRYRLAHISEYYLPKPTVAHLDRALGFEPRGREFESLRSGHCFRSTISVSPLHLLFGARVSDWLDVQGELLGKKKPAESGRVEGRVCSKEENMNSQQDWTTASD